MKYNVFVDIEKGKKLIGHGRRKAVFVNSKFEFIGGGGGVVVHWNVKKKKKKNACEYKMHAQLT